MCHCHVQFYLIGHRRDLFELIKEIPPLENFTHAFTESREPESELCAQADVILADLREADAAKVVRALEADRKDGAELIVLTDGEQAALLAESGYALTDIWTAPRSEAELRFHFQKWQEDYKLRRDCREADHFPDACVGGTPNPVWAKDKNGVHKADGSSLCGAERKTLDQVQGQRYVPIRDVEQDAPAGIESERAAMENREIHYREHTFKLLSDFLADNIDDIYMVLDGPASRIEFISSNIERVLGLSCENTENLLGQLGKVRYLTGTRVTRQELDALQPGMSLEPRETERMNQRTGERRWFRESVYCVSIQDRKELIVYISDRTAERKSQDALREALKMAKVAGQAKSAFMSNISHDIRTPMNAIMGMITLLREEADNPEQVRDYARKIDAASQHLLGLINDVLDMNKIESGSAVLNIGELNLAEIIDELNTIIRPQAREKKQEFEIFTTYLNYEHLLGDKLRINQILLNILSNAVKYTPAGGRIEMWVSELPQVDPNYSRVRFTVIDNGQGMSKEYLKVIFDPFTREQDTKLNEIQGTGLGMAITKSLVDLMNGTIKVTSKLGGGSAFVVELELRIQKQTDDLSFWSEHGVKRMIVADDDDEICHDIVKKMKGTGVKTDYATNGKRAVEMIRSAYESGQPYDLVLLDWKMPGLSGVEMTQRLRKNYPVEIPILLFSAYDWGDIEQEATGAGMGNFMPKPFFMSNFREAVERMMYHVEPDSAGSEESVMAGKRILVVDDIEINRIILVKILISLGAVCDEAKNGQEAVDQFNAQPDEYDIILMDIQMPVMNGYEATRAIRASGHSSAQKIAIIALTANAFVDDIRSALAAGMDAHIAKPIVLDQFKKAVADVLERKTQENR